MNEGMIQGKILLERIDQLVVEEEVRGRLVRWVKIAMEEANQNSR